MINLENKNPMNWDLDTFKEIINNILEMVYCENCFNNKLCERGLVFRFAYYLQEILKLYDYYVDCDYNLSSILVLNENGNYVWKGRGGKPISYKDGNGREIIVKRFIDIIVHKRIDESPDKINHDLICFEFKKWNSKKDGFSKDINNLKVLTKESGYQYKYGFHIIFGKEFDECVIDIYKNGDKIESVNSCITKPGSSNQEN